MNKLLYVIFSVQLALVTIADILACVWLGNAGGSEWYMTQPGNITNEDTGYQLPNFIGYWFTFFGLFNNFVPMFVRCVIWCACLRPRLICLIAFKTNIDHRPNGHLNILSNFSQYLRARVQITLRDSRDCERVPFCVHQHRPAHVRRGEQHCCGLSLNKPLPRDWTS